jgi:MoaA/NifB/PqqE/SkfB family radical SAM enzyme
MNSKDFAESLGGVITWNINTACNYRCSYCTQRHLKDRTRRGGEIEAFLRAFAQLPGIWEIKLSGGEPFLHPQLTELVAGIVSLGHYVSIVSNFSANISRLSSFLEAAGDHLKVFSISLHREYVNTELALLEFTNKINWLRSHIPTHSSVNVTCVATRDNLPHLVSLHNWFTSHQITFKIQPEKQDREVIKYSPEEELLLKKLGGHNQLQEIAFNFKGRLCWAGSRYFTLDDRGDAWRCYPARRYRKEYLGNILKGSLQLFDTPRPCLYNYCNCTVPIERNMMFIQE